MKTLKLFLAASCIAAFTLTACESFDNGIEMSTNEYSIDINNYVNQNTFDVCGTPDIQISANSPFTATILKTDGLDVDVTDRDRGNFILTPTPIDPVNYKGGRASLTRDITAYVRPFELQYIAGFESFNYPIRIRQRGADGTLYLTSDDIAAWKENHTTVDWDGKADQRYVLGRVKSMGVIHDEKGIRNPESAIGPLWGVPAVRQAYGKPQSLEALEMTLDVDGVELQVMIHYFKAYNLVSNLKLAVGDMVEMNVPTSGMITGSNVLWVSPLAIEKR